MPQLQSLPGELLLAIASHVLQSGLYDLALSCQRFNQLVTPLLYEIVFWQGDHHARRNLNDVSFFWQEDPGIEDSVNHQADALSIPLSGSRIFDLDAFTRTVLSSESLRSFTKSVDLRWDNKHLNDDDSVHRCLQALKSSSLRTLHLSPSNFHFDIPTRPAVTSLAFQHDSHLDYRSHQDARNSERLYTLLCIPSLIDFRLDGWPLWAHSLRKDRAKGKQYKVEASNVEVLTLSNSFATGEDLREVLSWPKALKRFTFEPYDNHNCEDLALVRSQFQRVLQHQRLTLEYLHAGAPVCNSGERNGLGA